MNSVKRLNQLADKFAMKLSQAQQVAESNQGPVVLDAFFGGSQQQEDFLKYINGPGSNFQKAVGSLEGAIKIDVQVNAAAKTANFVVSVGGKPAPKVVIDALNSDYAARFKKAPSQAFAERLAAKQVNPPNVSGATTFTSM